MYVFISIFCTKHRKQEFSLFFNFPPHVVIRNVQSNIPYSRALQDLIHHRILMNVNIYPLISNWLLPNANYIDKKAYEANRSMIRIA